jgi:ribosomal protein S12 methylthiotransferase accessory factor YcaO
VTVVTVEGDDIDGFLFSVGSACRENLSDSFKKALLEALQGRLYVRSLRERGISRPLSKLPESFAEHALYYSLNRSELKKSALATPEKRVQEISKESGSEDIAALMAALGSERRVLWRVVSHPWVHQGERPGIVVRVLVPGLQPLHGHHGFPHLGGSFWKGRSVKEYLRIGPHPFP